MGTFDGLREAVPYRKRAWVNEQLGADADEFAELLADPKVSPKAIARALNDRGIPIPFRTVYTWADLARGR